MLEYAGFPTPRGPIDARSRTTRAWSSVDLRRPRLRFPSALCAALVLLALGGPRARAQASIGEPIEVEEEVPVETKKPDAKKPDAKKADEAKKAEEAKKA